tara:strand:- start:3958 stop:4617 length:660 start_codon:yes stop_codon:yes gene_type:complete
MSLIDDIKAMDSTSKLGAIGGVMSIAQGLIGRGKRRDAQKKANKEYDLRRENYLNMDTSNIYADAKNAFSENVYEDITVNTQQADFMAEQQAQNQANIMQGLQGAAGGSGIAGLAQALANQSTQANAKASASIGMQESRNQQLIGKGELAVQKGEQAAEMMRLKGAERSRTLEVSRDATLLGMSQMDKAAADKAIADANASLAGGIGKISASALTGGLL